METWPNDFYQQCTESCMKKRANEIWFLRVYACFSDINLEVNPAAGVLTLLRNMVQYSPVNQDCLVRTNSVAVLGALLQKVCNMMKHRVCFLATGQVTICQLDKKEN